MSDFKVEGIICDPVLFLINLMPELAAEDDKMARLDMALVALEALQEVEAK